MPLRLPVCICMCEQFITASRSQRCSVIRASNMKKSDIRIQVIRYQNHHLVETNCKAIRTHSHTIMDSLNTSTQESSKEITALTQRHARAGNKEGVNPFTAADERVIGSLASHAFSQILQAQSYASSIKRVHTQSSIMSHTMGLVQEVRAFCARACVRVRACMHCLHAYSQNLKAQSSACSIQ